MTKILLLFIAVQSANIVLVFALALNGQAVGATIASYAGTCAIVLGFLLYAAIWHSRSRWPEASFTRRLANIMWMKR